MICPYCEEHRRLSRPNAKTCGEADCRRAHERSLRKRKRLTRLESGSGGDNPRASKRALQSQETTSTVSAQREVQETRESKEFLSQSHMSELRTVRDLDTGEVKRVHTEVSCAEVVQSETRTLRIKEKINVIQKKVVTRRQELLQEALAALPPAAITLEVYQRLVKGIETRTGHKHDDLFNRQQEYEVARYRPSAFSQELSPEEQAVLDEFELLRDNYSHFLNNPAAMEMTPDNAISKEVLRLRGSSEELLQIPAVKQWVGDGLSLPDILTPASPGFSGPSTRPDGHMFSDHVGILPAHLPRKIDYQRLARGLERESPEEAARLLQARLAESRRQSAPAISSAEEVTTVIDSFLETLATRLRTQDVMAAGGSGLLCSIWRNCARIRDACAPHFDDVRFEGGRVRVKACPCTLVSKLDRLVDPAWREVAGFEDLAALVEARKEAV